jgi:F-type H+-transporting ATPase subunit delta
MATRTQSRRIARQLFQWCLVAGTVDTNRARQVARRLTDGAERDSLTVLSEFQRLVRLDRDRTTALVETAVPLTADVRREVEAKLTRLHGPDLHMVFALNPALIGGIRIKVGSDVYDGSVRRRLDALEKML